MRKEMCENVKAALDMIKQKKSNLTKGEIVVVFQQVVYDLNKQGERMTSLENSVKEMKSELTNVKLDVQKILTVVEELQKEKTKPSFWERIPLLKEVPTVVWFIIWTIVIALCCLFGVNPTFIQYMKGG